jgi:hypothetical protein
MSLCSRSLRLNENVTRVFASVIERARPQPHPARLSFGAHALMEDPNGLLIEAAHGVPNEHDSAMNVRVSVLAEQIGDSLCLKHVSAPYT